MHNGIDIGAPQGSDVNAFASGTIVFAGKKGGYGNVIDIDHGNGIVTRYAHLSKIDVHVGQQIQKGSQIGAVGSTGLSTGPHLHFEVRKDGRAINPAPYLQNAKTIAPQGDIDPAELHNHEHDSGRSKKFTPAMQSWRELMASKVEYHMYSRGLRNNNWRSMVSAEGAQVIEVKMKEFGLEDPKQRNAFIDHYYGIFLRKEEIPTADYAKAKEMVEKLGALAELVDTYKVEGVDARFNQEDFGNMDPSSRGSDISPVKASSHRDFLESLVGIPYGKYSNPVLVGPLSLPRVLDSSGLVQFTLRSQFPHLQVPPLLDPSSEEFYAAMKLKKAEKPSLKDPKSYIITWKRLDGSLQCAWLENGTLYLASERHGEVVKYQGQKAKGFLSSAAKNGATYYEIPEVSAPAPVTTEKK